MSKYYDIDFIDFDFLNPRIREKYLYANSKSSEYIIWLGMLHRCFNKNSASYKHYGGRGIKVCDRWLGFDGFNNFYLDMGKRLDSKLSLDRIDNNGNYCKENCRWATDKEQTRNTRRVCMLEINGVIKPLIEWAEIYKVDYKLVRSRVKKKWDYKRALFEPKNWTYLTSGEVFNDWTVLEKVGHDYKCKCVCGNISLIDKFELINGNSKRCRSCANAISTSNRYKKEI